MRVAIIGGGAGGFFAALAAKEADPEAEVQILEKSARLLSKVRISGGGRCNVTHSCFDPKLLVQNYPRGHRELLGPFYRFQPKDTVEWFQSRGVKLKTEADGRMFPITDSSQTIINCLMGEAERLGIIIRTQVRLFGLTSDASGFSLDLGAAGSEHFDRVILATGSAKEGWDFARTLGHTVHDPVPSLFTFNIPKFDLVSLAGVSVPKALLRIERLEQVGPLLITHWGFSGPAALKLSAWGARLLAERCYEVDLFVDWLPDMDVDELRQILEAQKKKTPSKQVVSLRFEPLSKSLWKELCCRAGVSGELSLNSLGKSLIQRLVETLKRDCYRVHGKTTNKEEFVTCGGVSLKEVNFKTMESRLCKHLYFCGEVLDVDGVTGGFNFQNAWTSGWLAGQAAVDAL